MLTIAIVGRPNVGKSTLFNRLAGRRLALVHDTPGVTRDTRAAEARLAGRTVRLLDTAGLEEADAESLSARMREGAEKAIAEADLCLFVIDARAGVTPYDAAFAEVVRKSAVPVLLIANKCESRKGDAGRLEAFSLGLGEPVAVSAEHAEGIGDLEDALKPLLSTLEEERGETADGEGDDNDKPLRLAVIGRPNVGKSTLVNTLLGEEKMLTGPEAGITRDAVASDLTFRGRQIRLYDTAGMRRKARVVEKLEKLSVDDTLRAIRFAEVVVLVIDATQPFEKQDLQIAELAAREGRAIVVALNKWDLVEEPQAAWRELRAAAEQLLPQLRGLTLVRLSAFYREGVDRLLPAVLKAHEIWSTRLPTAALNRWLADATERHPPPLARGRTVRLRYMTQAKARPPTFVLFSSRADAVGETYLRYLANGLRESFDLPGTPLRFVLRKPRNPYEGKE